MPRIIGRGPMTARDERAAIATSSDESPVATCELRVGGMDCASCATSIESALRRLDGVRDVRVDVMGGKVRIGYLDDGVARGAMAGAIRAVGFTVSDDGGAAAAGGEGNSGTVVAPPSAWAPSTRLALVATSGAALVAGVAAGRLGAPRWIEVALLALATVAGGWYTAPRGLRAAWNRALDMNFLMTVAAAGAWVIGERGEAAATLFLFAVAELLETWSMDRARNAIRALVSISPAEATVRRSGVELRVPVTEVAVGEIVIVRPGEKLAVDGEVTGGRSSVDQAPITGESMPVDKLPGAVVFAGSLNGQGVLEIRSTKPASDTTLARIIHAVEEAQASRAPTQTFIDRFARVYTPAVVAIAILIAVVPPLLGAGEWVTWIYRALAMLVVACPCALVISTPVSIVSGLAGAARAGVLIKGGAHLEHLGAVTLLAIDKTGTLTEGRPSVTDVEPLDGASEGELLAMALAVERHSEHPLGRAVLAHGRAAGLAPPASDDFEALPGRGARATVRDGAGAAVQILVGNARLASEMRGVSAAARAAMQRFDDAGKTAVVVLQRATDGTGGGAPEATVRALGVIAIADRPRAHAREALDALRSAGIRRIVMLTGDNHGTARAVAASLGVTEHHAELLPDDKVRIVRELEAAGERVAFVGDGVNDAPALAAATVGIAMGAAGTDVAIETADVALMGDDLTALARAVRLSRKTLGIIRQNVTFSLVVKALFLVLAAGGWATLWMAVAADMGGSLLVVANGLRARNGGEASLPRQPRAE